MKRMNNRSPVEETANWVFILTGAHALSCSHVNSYVEFPSQNGGIVSQDKSINLVTNTTAINLE
jgi:hypothetical protein